MSLKSRLGFQTEPLYLMDGSAFIFRSFYAYRNMARSDGFPTNALYMVARLLLKLLREEKPSAFAFIMDGKGPNFRHEQFPAYKAQRSATPEPLVMQLSPLRDLLRLLGIPVLVSESCEADDCIASLALRYREHRPVVILGADKDLKQCLHENVVLWDPASKDEKITTLASFREESGLEPSSWPDYQALIGDSSDNIPGVPKIGPKTADELIRQFPTLEELFARLPAVPPKIRPKLEGQRENALLYRELTRLKTDTCPSVTDEDLALKEVDLPRVLALMAEYELRALAREVESMARAGYLRGADAGAIPASASKPAATAPVKAGAGGSSPVACGFIAGNTSGPQPVHVSNPTAETTAVQASLLPESPPRTDFPVLDSPDRLPPEASASRPWALLQLPWLNGSGTLLAAGGGEWLYTGSADELAAKAASTSEPFLIVTQDAKQLIKHDPAFRRLAPCCVFDLSLAAYLLSPEDRAYGWEHLVRRFGEQSASAYNSADNPGLFALDLYRFMREQLAGAGLEEVFEKLELPLVPVLANMEERGVRIDRGAFSDFLSQVQKDLDALTARIYRMAGREFNIRSAQQLSDVLFTVLELPRTGKTKGGAVSTSQESLEKLSGKHPIIESVLEYRKLEKLRSTYLEPLPALADGQDRIHTTFNQMSTATGRLSSSNPNLQNIPVRGGFGSRMRACFTAGPGNLLVSADYSQIELRVLAHLSGDPTLLEAFRNNQDIHIRTAGLLYDVPIEAVEPDMRRSAKTINFGLIYGMGAQKLAQDLRIGMKEAKTFIERYFERLARLKEFYDSIETQAREDGFVSTMAGRRRFTPDILSQNNQLRSQARRQAINTRIQGSAADIIKLAMIAVENDQILRSLGASLILQIHDELLLETPRDTAEAVGERLAELMAGVKPGGQALTVPLLVEWGIGGNWSVAH